MKGINDYSNIHDRIFKWVDSGLLWFDGEKSYDCFTDLDDFILKSFGYKGATPYSLCIKLDLAIFRKELDIDWLFGPHGLTLYKALLIRKGMR